MRALSLLLITVSASGCMFSPTNGQNVCGANANVTFSGWLPGANLPVSFQVATSPAGPWLTFANTTSGATGYAYAGSTYYPFSANVSVPTWVSSSTNLESFVRARVNASGLMYNLATFEPNPPYGSSPVGCFIARVNAGRTPIQAINDCSSSDSPVVELVAPFASTCPCRNISVPGNLTITNAVEAAQYACLQTLGGTLTVTESAPREVAFPSLVSVGGDVDLNYSFPVPQNGQTPYERRLIHFPVLGTIGGNAVLEARRNLGPKQSPNGLDAVTFVGGDITITLYDANPNVFDGLASHTGNITLQGFVNGALDVSASGSFTNLTQVNGTVHVRRFFASQGFFNALQQVNGTLVVGDVRLYPSQSFQNLTAVNGDLQFVQTKQWGPPWPLLTTVTGELAIVDHPNQITMTQFPISASVGSLHLENNASLVELGSSFQVTTGDITVSANPLLPQCRVDAFLASQVAGGWTGTADVSGTASGPCP